MNREIKAKSICRRIIKLMTTRSPIISQKNYSAITDNVHLEFVIILRKLKKFGDDWTGQDH